MSRLKKLAETWQDVANEEDEDEVRGPFFNQLDIIVSDVDPYYMVLFLESEFGKNLDGKFKRPNGEPYTQGYINGLRNGDKGVTSDFLAAVKEFIPNFEEEYKKFLDFTLSRGEQASPEETQKLQELAQGNKAAESGYAKFLMQATGLNIEQLQDAMGGVDPNTTFTDENGKRKIHKDMLKIVNNTFGITPQDYKDYAATKKLPTNNKIDKLKKYYTSVAASRIRNRMTKRA